LLRSAVGAIQQKTPGAAWQPGVISSARFLRSAYGELHRLRVSRTASLTARAPSYNIRARGHARFECGACSRFCGLSAGAISKAVASHRTPRARESSGVDVLQSESSVVKPVAHLHEDFSRIQVVRAAESETVVEQHAPVGHVDGLNSYG